MKKAVLCVTRSALGIGPGTYMTPCDIAQLPEDAFHFINRNVVDGPHTIYIGTALPQLLGYAVIICGGKVLTYYRKGGESRLHGMRSLGIGGHVDIDDFYQSKEKPFIEALRVSIEREIWEEVKYPARIGTRQMDSVIVDTSNDVGSVHIGVPIMVVVESEAAIKPDPEELLSPEWVAITDLPELRGQFENWSKLLIDLLTAQNHQ